MNGRLTGKVAVITGGTSGIGQASVRLFVAEGAQVVFGGRSEEVGAAMQREFGSSSRFVMGDVTREDDIKRTVQFAASEFGKVDCLFSNAGGPTTGGLEDVTAAEFRYAMDLLVGSVVFGIKYVTPIMKAQGGGSIISTSSVAALRTGMGSWMYSAAKAAVTQLSSVAGAELGRFGVRVNTISPGGILTPIFYGGSAAARSLSSGQNAAMMRKLSFNLSRTIPLGRAGYPEDVARAALFLASDESAFVNCHDLVVDGGMISGRRPDREEGRHEPQSDSASSQV